MGATGVGLLVPIGYVLMYGAFGLPGYGAFGSGIASAIICWVLALSYGAIVRFAPLYPGVEWGKGRRGIDPHAMLGPAPPRRTDGGERADGGRACSLPPGSSSGGSARRR